MATTSDDPTVSISSVDAEQTKADRVGNPFRIQKPTRRASRPGADRETWRSIDAVYR